MSVYFICVYMMCKCVRVEIYIYMVAVDIDIMVPLALHTGISPMLGLCLEDRGELGAGCCHSPSPRLRIQGVSLRFRPEVL